MTFDYGYRDSTNARLTGTIAAPSRDEAYRLLKEKGVRPTFVTLAPGLKNRLSALGKRGWSIIILGAVTLALCTAAVYLFRSARDSRAQLQGQTSSPLTRRQIYGDPALMEKLQLENYASLFAAEGDRVLAHFAQPARIDRFVATLRRDPAVRAKAAEALAALVDANFCSRQGQGQDAGRKTSDVRSSASTFDFASRETSELVRIVRWMRGEFAAYLADGTGTPATYLKRLLERQRYEAEFYARAKRELESVTDPVVWERRNDELRAIGAPTLPMPEE